MRRVSVLLTFLFLGLVTLSKGELDDEYEGEDDFDMSDVVLERSHRVHQQKRQFFPLPGYPPGNYLDGWESLPNATENDGTVHQEWTTMGASIPVYQTDRDPATVTRAIIIPPGMMRDCWYYYRVMQDGLVLASQSDSTIKEKDISVMSPCFLYSNDMVAGAAVPGNLVWKRTTWVSGQYNVNEDGPQQVPSFEIMDDLVDYYMDKELYPNLKSVVIAGHSAGAQMVQRYLMLRKPREHDDRLQFWIGNPSTFVWLSEGRPRPNDTCEGIDNWKYGLSDKFPGYSTGDARELGREGMVQRYFDRYTHYIWGTIDNIAGDTRCQAYTQGDTHYDRGRNFADDMYQVNGNKFPEKTTIQYLRVWHDVDAIVHMTEGWDYLFRWLPGMSHPPPRGSPPEA